MRSIALRVAFAELAAVTAVTVGSNACTRRATVDSSSNFRTTARPQQDARPTQLVAPQDAGELQDASVEQWLEAEARRASLAPLFVRKVRCLAATDPSGFSRQRRQDGGYRGEPLTMAELVARPWLWGLYPSFCPMGAGLAARDASLPSPFDVGAVEARISSIANEYLRFGHVDDAWRFAPFDCLMPSSGAPADSLDGAAPHDRKLYYLYARDRAAYLAHRDVAGQIVVKEAWAPEEVPMSEAISTSYPAQCARVFDGRCLQPGAFKGLFVMLRVSEPIESDAGWIYATVDPAGTITASGRIASCMNCHQRAPHGRLFGLVNREPRRSP